MGQGTKSRKLPAEVIGNAVKVINIATGKSNSGTTPGRQAGLLGRVTDCEKADIHGEMRSFFFARNQNLLRIPIARNRER
jgi:hypothetical protein